MHNLYLHAFFTFQISKLVFVSRVNYRKTPLFLGIFIITLLSIYLFIKTFSTIFDLPCHTLYIDLVFFFFYIKLIISFDNFTISSVLSSMSILRCFLNESTCSWVILSCIGLVSIETYKLNLNLSAFL